MTNNSNIINQLLVYVAEQHRMEADLRDVTDDLGLSAAQVRSACKASRWLTYYPSRYTPSGSGPWGRDGTARACYERAAVSIDPEHGRRIRAYLRKRRAQRRARSK